MESKWKLLERSYLRLYWYLIFLLSKRNLTNFRRDVNNFSNWAQICQVLISKVNSIKDNCYWNKVKYKNQFSSYGLFWSNEGDATSGLAESQNPSAQCCGIKLWEEEAAESTKTTWDYVLNTAERCLDCYWCERSQKSQEPLSCPMGMSGDSTKTFLSQGMLLCLEMHTKENKWRLNTLPWECRSFAPFPSS